MDINTVIGSRLHTSFRVNGLFVPANSIAHALQQYTDPALFNTNGVGKYHLSKSGSLFRFKCFGRYFALVCAHQVLSVNAGYDHDQLCIKDNTGKMFTSHQVVFPENDLDFELDVLLYEYTKPVLAGKLPQHMWFNVSETDFEVGCPRPDKVLCIGYPSHRNNIDYELDEYAIGGNAVWGEQTVPSIEGRLAFEVVPPLEYDPIGMSGAPVFGIHVQDLEPQVFFAGILSDASRRKFHFLSRKRIYGLVQHMLRTET